MSDRRKPYFASEQRRAQRLVELFNNNERLWNSVAGKRRLRMFELHDRSLCDGGWGRDAGDLIREPTNRALSFNKWAASERSGPMRFSGLLERPTRTMAKSLKELENKFKNQES